MGRFGLNWTPAGYLPAPKPARFISEAEQAAAKLPPSIKAQSLKNALLRGGAKPLELEYAGIDDFIAANQGKSVSAADVLAHLQDQGPLGQLKRVEQQSDGPSVPLSYAPSIRSPFDSSTASGQTMYSKYTVPGKRGDFTGYREVLLEDPKNRRNHSASQGMVEAHHSGGAERLEAEEAHAREVAQLEEILGRYNLTSPEQINWDRINEPGYLTEDDASRAAFLRDTLADYEAWPSKNKDAVNAHSADYWARYNEYPDRIAVQNIQSDAGQAAAKAHLEFDPNFEPSNAAHSPLARDDNWKNLMARHIALQSIAGGGKPITIPTGQQMVDVEGFGLATHRDNPYQAAIAADSYNADLVRRLQKIFRGLHPEGAVAARAASGEPPPAKIRFPLPRPEDATIWERHFVHSDLLPPIRERAMKAMDLADSDPDLHIWADGQAGGIDEADEIAPYGFFDPSVHEELVRIASDLSNPEARQAAIEAMNLWRRAGEISHAEKGNQRHDAQMQPGWTITPSPQAVRAALEKGLPIMSLAPLLLAPGNEEQR